MIELPDFSNAFEYENYFYLSCKNSRLSKIVIHYELFKMAIDIPGEIIECGVFKGCSLIRFAMLRNIFNISKKIIGFDVFGEFPRAESEADRVRLKEFVQDAGSESISVEQLLEVLKNKNIENVELVPGDICETVPKYVEDYPELSISLLHLDADLYEPTAVALKCLWPRIVKGGVLILDNYNDVEGETKAVDEYFKDKNLKICKFPFCETPSYIIKE